MDKRLKLNVLIAGMIFAVGCIQQPESNINNLTIGASKSQPDTFRASFKQIIGKRGD